MLRVDANAIKFVVDMATGEADTFLTLSSAFVTDMYQNPITSVDNGAAMPIITGGFTPDTTNPELLKFDIDMDQGKITLSFDETVSGASIMPDEIIIRDTTHVDDAGASYQLTGAITGGSFDVDGVPVGEPWAKVLNTPTFPHGDSNTITFYFTKTDLDEIKRLNMCSQADDCYLVHTEYLVFDLGLGPNTVLRCE